MIIDIIVAIVLVISAGISFLRGFIRELFTIAGVVGGVVAAIFFSPPLAKVFKGWFGAEGPSADSTGEAQEVAKLFDLIPMHYVADACAYGAIFIAFVIIISVIAQFFSAAVKAAGLGPIDRTFGVIFGLLRAVVLLALLYLPFHLLMDQGSKDQYFEQSKTHFYIEKVSGFIAGYLPSSKEVEDKVKEVQSNQIKDKLFENDILFNKDKKVPSLPIAEEVETQQPNTPTGYDKEQRKEIQNLFREPTYNE